ncbi:MAG: GNAT family N-acetyltransferase [Capsulimonadales bacterium]|nr:GNAT family N-acetyltransferase [Capsulimonadales bacterium]
MPDIVLAEREMTDAEFARMNAGFDENSSEHGVVIQASDRFGYVATDGETFVGCASGLAYRNGPHYNGWFYLTDLFVEKPYRRNGLGALLLRRLEERVRILGVRHMQTDTAEYEGLAFYRKQGYRVLYEQESWFSSGQSRFGLRKDLL